MASAVSQAFFDSLSTSLGQETAERLRAALQEPASVSVRLNPSKPADLSGMLADAVAVPWSAVGRILGERPVFTLNPLFHCGAFYVQDSSAMFVGQLFRDVLGRVDVQGRPVRVLDLCAAPGGKTTDMTASLRSAFGDGFILVSNEVMRSRATVLADNVARWGDPNVVVTSVDPKAFARLEGWFDIIVADVPCSGEGMFRKDDEAVAQWSPDNVMLCASRQRRILADVWPALAEGGVMVYSTCTFNDAENDGNASWICSELGAEGVRPCGTYDGVLRTGCGYVLVPGMVPGEGQYCAAMVKTSHSGTSVPRVRLPRPDAAQKLASPFFNVPVTARMKGELIVALPEVIAQEVAVISSVLPLLSSGCAVGQLKGRDLVPDEDLALCTCHDPSAFPQVEVDEAMALKYLHRDAIVLPDAPKGFVRLSCGGVGLGFVKNLGSRCNNLHPQGRRILMDIQ